MTLQQARESAGITDRYFKTFRLFMKLKKGTYRKNSWGIAAAIADSSGLDQSVIVRHMARLAEAGLVSKASHGRYEPTKAGIYTYSLLQK